MMIGFRNLTTTAIAMFDEFADAVRMRRFMNDRSICEWILITIGTRVVIHWQYANVWLKKDSGDYEYSLPMQHQRKYVPAIMAVSAWKVRLYVHAHY